MLTPQEHNRKLRKQERASIYESLTCIYFRIPVSGVISCSRRTDESKSTNSEQTDNKSVQDHT
jgi:hypothetical protein